MRDAEFSLGISNKGVNLNNDGKQSKQLCEYSKFKMVFLTNSDKTDSS